MKIVIENIALIKQAEIELNGITVVAGLNKTGKTTISKALYAMISAYRNLPLRVFNSKKNGIRDAFVTVIRKNKDLLENISSWMFDLEEEFLASIHEKEILEWSEDSKHDGVKEYINQWLYSKNEYEDYVSSEDLNVLYKKICTVLERPNAEYERFLIESFVRNVFKKQISCFYNHESGGMYFYELDDAIEAKFLGNELSEFSQNIVSDMRAIYIESINLLDLIQSNRAYGRIPMKISQPAATCIRMLNRTVDEDKETYEKYAESKKIDEIINYIIQKVTHGSLENDASGINFKDDLSRESVELSNLSAGLKVFVVIQTLLENGSLKHGDVLLIDEPEVNLHPEWQIVLAEVLILLHKELGIIIYINSHSPYFIRAIEVKMAQNELTFNGKFYLTVCDEDRLCHVEDVSQNTERIYELLYRPLEDL